MLNVNISVTKSGARAATACFVSDAAARSYILGVANRTDSFKQQ